MTITNNKCTKQLILKRFFLFNNCFFFSFYLSCYINGYLLVSQKHCLTQEKKLSFLNYSIEKIGCRKKNYF